MGDRYFELLPHSNEISHAELHCGWIYNMSIDYLILGWGLRAGSHRHSARRARALKTPSSMHSQERKEGMDQADPEST